MRLIMLALAASLAAAAHAAPVERGLQPLASGYEAARQAAETFRDSRYDRASLELTLLKSLTLTSAGPAPFVLKGRLYKGLLLRLGKDGALEASLDLRPKKSEPYKPVEIHLPAACGDMAKLAVQVNSWFEITGKIQRLELGKELILVVIEADAGLQCTAGTGN